MLKLSESAVASCLIYREENNSVLLSDRGDAYDCPYMKIPLHISSWRRTLPKDDAHLQELKGILTYKFSLKASERRI